MSQSTSGLVLLATKLRVTKRDAPKSSNSRLACALRCTMGQGHGLCFDSKVDSLLLPFCLVRARLHRCLKQLAWPSLVEHANQQISDPKSTEWDGVSCESKSAFLSWPSYQAWSWSYSWIGSWNWSSWISKTCSSWTWC